MPAQDAFNVGRDATLNITAGGIPLKPTIITEFEFKQDTVQLKSKPLNGAPIFQEVPDGWSGSFSVDRADPTLDDFFSQAEDNWYAGDDQTIASILQTIADAAVGAVGPIHQYLFEGVQMKLDQGGNYKQDDKVMQRVAWVASRRRKIA